MTEPPGGEVWADAQAQLSSLSDASRRRHVNATQPAASISFSSNDYLGLSRDPRVKAAAAEALERYGAGAGASRLVTGNLAIHHELEEELAAFKNVPGCLLFSSGYLANLSTIEALSYRADGSRIPVFFDRLAHASLVDGARQTPRYRTFRHNDVESLRERLQSTPHQGWPSALVVTEGVFSMDGDTAPLRDLATVCEKYRAILIIDDAHGTGTVGPGGRGSAALAEISSMEHIVQTGTLSKALGSQGGYVAGSLVMRDLLINRARPFIFETALAPASAGAALQALRILKNEPELTTRLRANYQRCAAVLGIKGVTSPIIPVVLGSEESALDAAARLRGRGILAVAIRPPSVPVGVSRIRFTVSAAHTDEDMAQLETAWNAIKPVSQTSQVPA